MASFFKLSPKKKKNELPVIEVHVICTEDIYKAFFPALVISHNKFLNPIPEFRIESGDYILGIGFQGKSIHQVTTDDVETLKTPEDITDRELAFLVSKGGTFPFNQVNM